MTSPKAKDTTKLKAKAKADAGAGDLRTLPLFPRETRKNVEKLVISRLEDGGWRRVPELLTAADLPDREAVRARFGGGRYDVIGRDAKRITARTRFVLEGLPLPLGDEAVLSHKKREKLREFATSNGEREAIVFGLLESDTSLPDVVQRTGIEARLVRAIYLEWLTPLGQQIPTTADGVIDLVRAREQARRAKQDAKTAEQWERDP